MIFTGTRRQDQDISKHSWVCVPVTVESIDDYHISYLKLTSLCTTSKIVLNSNSDWNSEPN